LAVNMMIEEKMLARVPVDGNAVFGDLVIPNGAKSIVVFAHGSGSSRFTARNTQVARQINQAGMATFLIDLMTRQEEEIDISTGEYRFNIEFLSQRLMQAAAWLRKSNSAKELNIGLLGANTGAAAALIAAAKLPNEVKAVVSRGGRPDLAGDYLFEVKAPTLLIVGGRDGEALDFNRNAMEHIPSEKKLAVVAGATQFFEEPEALDKVSSLATGWFKKYLR